MRDDEEKGLKEKFSFWIYRPAFFDRVLVSVSSLLNLCDRSGLQKGKSFNKVFLNLKFRALETKT